MSEGATGSSAATMLDDHTVMREAQRTGATVAAHIELSRALDEAMFHPGWLASAPGLPQVVQSRHER